MMGMRCPPPLPTFAAPMRIVLHLLFLLLCARATAQEVRRIELLHADLLEFSRSSGIDAKRLLGHVQFSHEGALMWCDSAHLFDDNSLDAFGSVHISKGDTTELWCDKLHYDGNTRLAQARSNVKLIDRGMTLTTHHLDYDMAIDIGWYINKGRIVDKENILISEQGRYVSTERNIYFRYNVTLDNPKYTLYCDTLRYHTATEVAHFLGPSCIVSEQNTIVCRFGWYDTRNDRARFWDRATIEGDQQTISGDTLYYDRKAGYGRALGQVAMHDTLEDVSLFGERAIYVEEYDRVMVTDSALMRQVMGTDTLHMHADTLYSFIGAQDRRTMLAWRHVQYHRTDMQGRCDSLAYSYADSTLRMYGLPVMWSDNNQMTADSIHIRMRNNRVDRLWLHQTAFIASLEDSAMYNQIRGKVMEGTFKDQKLYKVVVRGNGQTIYYAGDDPDGPDSVNKAESTDMLIYIDANKVERITFIQKPDATLFPLAKVNLSDMFLKDFTWRIEQRPVYVEDIFCW